MLTLIAASSVFLVALWVAPFIWATFTPDDDRSVGG